MKNWLKYYFLGFFSNKYSKEGANRSFWNVLLSLFLAIVILSGFFTGGFMNSYTKHYKEATNYRDFVNSAFYDESSHRINLVASKVKDNVTISGVEQINNRDLAINPINTFKNDADKKEYGINDCNLIVDMRNANDVFVEFSLTFYGSDETKEISFEEFAKLDSKDGYTNYKYVPTDKEIDVNDAIENLKVNGKSIQEYLQEKDSDNLKTIIDNNDLSKEEKNIQIYRLYLQTYYEAGAFNLFSSSTYYLPTIKYFYETEYTRLDDNSNLVHNNFLIILKDELLAAFVNDKKVEVSYLGNYAELKDGFALVEDQYKDQKNIIYNNIDTFMVKTFTSCYSLSLIQRIIIVFRNVPFLLLILATLGLFVWIFNKVSKQTYGERFFGSFKIVCSYLLISSFIGGLTCFITSFFKNTSNSMLIGFATMLLTLIARCIVLVLVEFIKYKRNPLVAVNIPTNNNVENIGNNLDLSHVESGTKVIVNDKANDDDETMELM